MVRKASAYSRITPSASWSPLSFDRLPPVGTRRSVFLIATAGRDELLPVGHHRFGIGFAPQQEVCLRRIAGYFRVRPARVEVLRQLADVGGVARRLIAQVHGPADNVGLVLGRGVGRPVGHEQGAARGNGHGDRLDRRQILVVDGEIAAYAVTEVLDNAPAVASRHHAQAAIVGRGIDEGDPAGDDQFVIAVGTEIAGVLVPGDGAAVPSGNLGPDSVDRCADNLFADQRFEQGQERWMTNEVEKRRIVVGELGLRLPIQAGKGYSISYKAPPNAPSVPISLGPARVGVSTMGDTLRFAGTLELSGLNLDISAVRVSSILKAVPDYLPGLNPGKLEMIEIWRGMRPCTPDGLPLLGRARSLDNLTVAAGHAMIGISLAPITGQLVSQIVAREAPSIDLKLTQPDRFG